MLPNKLYGIEFKETNGKFILVSLKGGIREDESKNIISLYKEYFDKEYPSFEAYDNNIWIEGDIEDLKKKIRKQSQIILKQRFDKRIKKVEADLVEILNETTNNIIYLLYKGGDL